MVDNKTKLGLVAGVAAATIAAATMALLGKTKTSEKKQVQAATVEQAEIVVLIGDVGGTNVRLMLRKLCLRTRTSTEIKAFTKIAT